MVYAKLCTKGRFLSRSEVGLFCFEKKRRKKLGGNGDCITAYVAEIALRAAITGQQQEVASMISEHLICKVFNTVK